MEKHGPPIMSGEIYIEHVTKSARIALFFFQWVETMNEVIDNLNLVLADLNALSTMHLLWSGSPRKRYYLLIRLYLYEFFSFKEIMNQTLDHLERWGYLKKPETKEISAAFYEAFKQSIAIRNNFVHGLPLWKNERHFNLNLVGGAWETGHCILKEKSGEVFSLEKALQETCGPMVQVLTKEGNRVSAALKDSVKVAVRLIEEAAPSESSVGGNPCKME
jgi:hypothetical protein